MKSTFHIGSSPCCRNPHQHWVNTCEPTKFTAKDSININPLSVYDMNFSPLSSTWEYNTCIPNKVRATLDCCHNETIKRNTDWNTWQTTRHSAPITDKFAGHVAMTSHCCVNNGVFRLVNFMLLLRFLVSIHCCKSVILQVGDICTDADHEMNLKTNKKNVFEYLFYLLRRVYYDY